MAASFTTRASLTVPTSVRWLEAVTVRAKNSEIDEPIIPRIAVDVSKDHDLLRMRHRNGGGSQDRTGRTGLV